MNFKSIHSKKSILFAESVLLIFMLTIIFIVTRNSRSEVGIMPTRITSMDRYIEDVNNGQFPRFVSEKSNDHAIGFYMIGAYLGSWLGVNGKEVFILIEFVLILTGIFLCPYIIYYVSKNFRIAIVSPILLLVFSYRQFFVYIDDVHYGGCFAAIISFPLLYAIWKEAFDRKHIFFSVIIMISMMIGNILRSQSSLAVSVMLTVCMARKALENRKDIRKIFCILCILVLMVLTSNFLAVTVPNKLSEVYGEGKINVSNTAWHNLLIGLGYIKNDYGLEYKDQCGERIIQEKYGNDIAYGTDEYYELCKNEYFYYLKTDPIFCLKGYLYKFVYMSLIIVKFQIVTIALWLLFMAMAFRLKNSKVRDDKKKLSVFTLDYFILNMIYYLIGMVEPTLAAPDIGYAFNAAFAIPVFCVTSLIYPFCWTKKLDRLEKA